MDDKSCPALFVSKVIDWGFEDPKDTPIEKVRQIRDEIKKINRQLTLEIFIFSFVLPIL